MKFLFRSTFLATLIPAILASQSGCLESPLLDHGNGRTSPGPRLDQIEAACALVFPGAGLCASLEWQAPPSSDAKGSFLLRFWDAKAGSEHGPYLAPATSVFVKLWMPSMGHGSSPVTVEPARDSSGEPIPGVYRASEVFFVMGGPWEIWIQLRAEREVVEQAKVDLTL